ncbi:LOW QUALITY PROTEIN: DNA dC-_dU-editing enzyme APOBEC-3B-like [Dama dama]
MEPPHSRQSPAYRGYNQMPWIRNHVWRLDPDTFYFQFHNLLYANGRNCSYICYRVERRKHRSCVAFDWGVFHNQVNAGTRCHTELHFLSWFCKMKLHPDECYHITWYMSWSPCVKCAKQVANFLARYRNVTLSIFAARLYYFQDVAYRQGLLGLSQQGARVDIMSYREFKYCWKKFVDSQRRRFKPWKKLNINYQQLVAELDDILGASAAKLRRLGGLTRGIYYLAVMEARSPRPRCWQAGFSCGLFPRLQVAAFSLCPQMVFLLCVTPGEPLVSLCGSQSPLLIRTSGLPRVLSQLRSRSEEVEVGTSEYGFGAHSSAPTMAKGIFELSGRSGGGILVLPGCPHNPTLTPPSLDIVTARAHSAHSWSCPHIAASDEALRMVMERRAPEKVGLSPRKQSTPGPSHPWCQNRKGAGPWLSWLGGCFQIRGCPKSKGPGRGNGGRVSMTEGWAGSGLPGQGDCVWTPGTRNTMNLLRETLFKHQFGNQPRVPPPHYRRKTYLCYQLKQLDDSTLDRGCFRNKKQRHAEIRFIDKINSLNLDPRQSYKIICYITWSPCPRCASELVDFIMGNDHLNLQIFASRLYFHWKKPFQRGLQQLQEAGISVAVMTHTEFEDCWEQFVDNQSRPFQPWEKLQQYSASITRRLQRILTIFFVASLVAQMIKNLLATQEIWI